MSERILHRESWYHPIKSSTIYEGVYERRILANAGHLFPGFHCAPFKKAVHSRFGTGIPDLVLVDKNYRTWIVVEVELETHSLQSDVELQVKQFAYGEYDIDHVTYLNAKIRDLDQERLRMLMLGTEPSILVIVPVVKPSWSLSLRSYRATIMQVEMFEDDTKQQLLRVDGDYPRTFENRFVSRLFRDGVTARGLRMEHPGAIENLDEVRILVSGYRTTWKVVRTRASIWLMPASREPLSGMSDRSFRLMLNDSDEYLLEEDQ
jgi:hypothetical protein